MHPLPKHKDKIKGDHEEHKAQGGIPFGHNKWGEGKTQCSPSKKR